MDREMREFTERVRLAQDVGLVPAEVWRSLDLDQDGATCERCRRPADGRFCYDCETAMFGEYC